MILLVLLQLRIQLREKIEQECHCRRNRRYKIIQNTELQNSKICEGIADIK
jgi:hypothetical protein